MTYLNETLPEKSQCRRKQFVEVVAAHTVDGSVCPKTIILTDGRHYDIDKYHDPRPAKMENSGNQVTVYEVWIKGKWTDLFKAGDRWWVLMKQ